MPTNPSYIQIPADTANTGKLVHHIAKQVNGMTMQDRVDVLGDPETDTNARVLTTPPAADDAGLVVRPVLPVSFAVTGAFYQQTQPVSLASVPTHAVTGSGTFTVAGTVAVSNFPASQAVTGTFWQATQPVSAAALPLPAGASTEATLAALSAKVTAVNTAAVTQAAGSAISIGTSSGKTLVLKTGSLATSATTADQVVLTYTVTAGKTLYLTGYSLQARLTTFAATATLFGQAYLETPSGTKGQTFDLSGPGTCLIDTVTFAEPLPIAAGQVVRIVCTPAATTGMTWKANLSGYER